MHGSTLIDSFPPRRLDHVVMKGEVKGILGAQDEVVMKREVKGRAATVLMDRVTPHGEAADSPHPP